ncbi:hypothetical protein E2C01_085482 [Portunus trituberculatus]|uniref:Uncharacterized protein n=1 Tax=Portunus trituberculatus TaxID=210409 RepID=A0A5B7J7R2_PORTR|nr:hypothetical protein [Portunus trituberculatus]
MPSSFTSAPRRDVPHAPRCPVYFNGPQTGQTPPTALANVPRPRCRYRLPAQHTVIITKVCHPETFIDFIDTYGSPAPPVSVL